MPRMHEVDSEAIAAVGYERATRRLHVRFVDTGLYVYDDVDEDLYEGLLHAESKGSYFNLEIKPRGFAYERRD